MLTRFTQFATLKTYFRIAFRVFSRNKSFTFINLSGLTLGITAFLLIFSFVYHEFSYDQFIEEKEQVYRVVQQFQDPEEGMSTTGGALAPTLIPNIPAVDTYCRLHRENNFVQVSYEGEEQIYEEKYLVFTDVTFFNIFDLPLVEGSKDEVLQRPGSVVLTEKLAKKYFGERDPLGQSLEIKGEALRVEGVLQDLPQKTHLKIDMLVSMATFKQIYGVQGTFTSYWWPAVWTYVKLRPDADVTAINQQLPELIKQYRDADMAANYVPQLQPLQDIHLFSNYYNEMKANASIDLVFLLAFVGLLILLIACINYMNLSIVQAARRAKEIGIRKANGARRSSLVLRFMSESILYTGMALLISLFLLYILLPEFSSLIQRELVYNDDYLLLWVLIPLFLLTVLLSGFYPALFVTRYRVDRALRANQSGLQGNNLLYRSMVVFQFVASIGLIAATMVTYGQLQYMREASLGFDQEHILSIRIPNLVNGVISSEKGDMLDNIENVFSRLSQVKMATTADYRPGFGQGGGNLFEISGMSASVDDQDRINRMAVGYDYFRMLNLNIIAGRNFDDRLRTETESIIVNEALLDKLGFSDPETILGQEIRTYVRGANTIYGERVGRVIGVVEDFHAASLRRNIEPILFMPSEGMYKADAGTFLIKTAEGADIPELLLSMKESWKHYYPENTFDAQFLDESLERRYQAESRLGNMMLIFSVLAILIACLGLYGLAAYLMERKTKEIGIRKVLGAAPGELILSFNRDFLWLLGVAALIAIPLSVYWADHWLQQFAYRIEPGIVWYLGAGGICLLIALLTVSYKAFQAARINPVRALRDE